MQGVLKGVGEGDDSVKWKSNNYIYSLPLFTFLSYSLFIIFSIYA